MKIILKKEFEAKYLNMSVAVRYGDEDMPFDATFREGDFWHARIDLDEKRIVNWPKGKTLKFTDMKVCDEGKYSIQDKDGLILAEIDGYVPNLLLPGDYGDYLSLDIDGDGFIKNWLPDARLSNFEVTDED